jgi:4-aminobutyrate aminotransferase / (S)-3-amino-2-methylpropionate transaminase / 5-aminovalerate transaminase
MAKEFPLVAELVETVSTRHRKLSGMIPNQETVDHLLRMRAVEPQSMRGQPPIIWDRAEGCNVFDAYGNIWLDFSSGVLITNAGHGHPRIVAAIRRQIDNPLLTTYCFPNMPRVNLVQKLASLAPRQDYKVFLLSTGGESTECALKLMRTFGLRQGDSRKNIIVSFDDAFHGRTMGAQQIGGSPAGKAWIKNLDPELVQVPFPDGFHCEDTRFELFEKTLAERNIPAKNVAGVIAETYQGAGPNFMPKAYAQALRQWCDRHGALLCFDEVQAGFGRCGTLWGFDLYGVVPDLFCVGKGVSSSLPVSAVIGRPDVMDLYGPNEMTSTHSGNPVCCAAALANIEAIIDQRLVENAARLGPVLKRELAAIKAAFPRMVGFAPAEGLVGGLLVVKPGTKEPNYELAWDVVNGCFRRGLLLFAPVGVGGGCVKIAPPLCITEDALREGCGVLRQVFDERAAKAS